MLTLLGLSDDDQMVYRLLATRPAGWGIREVSEHLGIDESRVHRALDRLAQLTLLREAEGDSGTWRVVTPRVGLTTLLRQQEDELLQRQRELAAAQVSVARMIDDLALSAVAVAPDECQRLIGIDRIRAKLEEFSTTARESFASFMPGGAHNAEAIAAAMRDNERLLSRGVRMRTVCLDSARNHPPTLEYLRALNHAGGEVRTIASLPLRIILVDSNVALVPIDAADSGVGAVELRLPGAVTALQALFEQAWEQALPFGTARLSADPDGIRRQDLELLRLEAQGMTDEAVANRLGVSVSTVRRGMARLMEALGARSRFEAGLRAAQRGWL